MSNGCVGAHGNTHRYHHHGPRLSSWLLPNLAAELVGGSQAKPTCRQSRLQYSAVTWPWASGGTCLSRGLEVGPVVVSVGVGLGKGFRVGTVERWASRGQGKALNVMPNGMGFMQGDGEPRGVQAGQDATSPSTNADPAGFSKQLTAGVGGRPGRQADWHSFMPVSITHFVPGPLLGTGDETP